MAQVKEFKVGKTYKMRSICDSECWWYYKVVSRTKSTVVIIEVKADGSRMGTDKARFRISPMLTKIFKSECIKPLGTFSMSPTLSADCIH